MARSDVSWLSAIGLLVMSALPGAAAAREVSVEFSVRDPGGQPVPFVTIWSAQLPDGVAPVLSLDDVRNAARRYAGSFEYAHQFSRPVERLRLPPMADVRGHARDRIAADELAAIPNGVARIPYVFLRRGYLPEALDVDITPHTRSLRLVVTLRPDPAAAGGVEPAYLADFDSARAELSDWRRNEVVSAANQRRIEGLRARLEQAAEQALAANDRAVAARIFARIETLPELLVLDGKPVGFQQVNPDSPRARAALERALEVDPDADDYLKMRAYSERRAAVRRRLSAPMSAADVQTMRDFLDRESGLFEALDDRLWTLTRITHAYDLASVGRHPQAMAELDRIERSDPRGEDYAAYRGYLRRRQAYDRPGEPVR